MRRRDFITGLGSAAAAAPALYPLVARAQQPDQVKRVAVLMDGIATDSVRRSWLGSFTQVLRNLGWVEGRNIRADIRWNGGDIQRARTDADELVGLSPNVILTPTTPNLREVLRATRTIPVVFTLVSDPVVQGFVPSLLHPAGNATGFANYEFSIGGKWLDLLKQIAPKIARVAVVFNPQMSPQSRFFLDSIEATAPSLGVDVIAAPVLDIADLEPAIEGLSHQQNVGLIFPPDTFTSVHQKLIVDLLGRHGLPSIASNAADFARDGGLMYYGASQIEQFRGAAFYVDRILKGEKPGDLPVQLPSRYDLIINLKTANALGIELPMGLMLSANEVIE